VSRVGEGCGSGCWGGGCEAKHIAHELGLFSIAGARNLHNGILLHLTLLLLWFPVKPTLKSNK